MIKCALTLRHDGAVEDLAAQGADPALGEDVGHRGADRGLEELGAFGSEHPVEGVDGLAATVTGECSGIGESFVVAQVQVAGCLGGPGAGWVGGATR